MILWYFPFMLIGICFPFLMHKTDITFRFKRMSLIQFYRGSVFLFSFQPSNSWAVCSLPRLNTYLHLPFFFSMAGLWLCILHFWTFYFRRQTKWCMQINRIKRQHVRAISRAGKRNSLHTRRRSRFAHINANISLCVPFFENWAF